jgi:hypothetical protein
MSIPIASLDELEELIDRYGLPNVVQALADVCFEKAAHIMESYSDKPLAEAWERDGERLARLSDTFAQE